LIEKLPENDQDRLRCYDALGSIELSMKRFDNSLEWYKKSLDLRKSNFPENLAENYIKLATVSLEIGDDEHAFEYFKELSIILKQSDDECYNLIYCYTRMAMIYQKQNNQTQALSCYYRALSIMMKHNCSDDACYATMYSNLGTTCDSLALYQLALGYYNASLEIKQKLYSTSNPGIVALAYKHVACAHESLNNVQQARMNFEKALEFYRQLDPADQSSVAEIEEIIRNLPAVEQNSSNS
jgi:tetratricopeptide (TPR) repeat protein